MPQVNLTALTGQELRQRLDASRARGDATLAYEILREMAARREAGTGRRPLRKRAEPHLVNIDLSDPVEAEELPPHPGWRPPAETRATDPDPEPAAEPAETLAPTGMHLVEPQPPPTEATDTWDQDLRLRAGELETRRPRPRRRPQLRVAAGFVAGVVCGVAVGGWAGWWVARDGTFPAVALLQPANPAPSPPTERRMLDVSVPQSEPVAPLDPPIVQPSDLNPGAEAIKVDQQSGTLAPPSETVQIAEATAPEPERPPAPAAASCAAEPTPADRQICADPGLQELQRELRRAYADALEAHEDRALLRQRQLAWRDARNRVSDAASLAQLYEQRIQKLRAAAAAARSQR